MNSLVNSQFCRTYNPNTQKSILSHIKRLLTSRCTESQSKACTYLIETINKYKFDSKERNSIIDHLLYNDIVVFLCEATSNLDFALFRSILECIQLLWHRRSFFEEHATQVLSAVIRTLLHYITIDGFSAVDICLRFIFDFLDGIRSSETTSPLSQQSAYNTEQLLASLITLAARAHNKTTTILSGSIILNGLISYSPPDLNVKGNIAMALAEILQKWFDVLMRILNHIVIVGDREDFGSMLALTCLLGINTLSLITNLEKTKEPIKLVYKILVDEQEIKMLKESASKMMSTIHNLMKELVVFAKDNQSSIDSEEHEIFFDLLLKYMLENKQNEIIMDFCDTLFSKGYLTMLIQQQLLSRNDECPCKANISVLGEILKVLTKKYLTLENDIDSEISNDIEMDLSELQYCIETQENVGTLLRNNPPYTFLVYLYFYCQTIENSQDSNGEILPYLVEYILRLPEDFKPPGYIIKALWLVFAMSNVSNASQESIDSRVYLEKVTDRLLILLYPEPTRYYTHNPAILLWAFSSTRIQNSVRLIVLSEWFKLETTLPSVLVKDFMIWELLLNIIINVKDSTIVNNCIEALYDCISEADEEAKNDLTALIWSLLPGVLSKALIDCDDNLSQINISYLLDIAIQQMPNELAPSTYLPVATYITTLFTKNTPDSDIESRYHFESVCLRVCLSLLGFSNSQDDNKVLLTYTNRVGFLPSVLSATNSSEDTVACKAMELLSYIVQIYAKNQFQPHSTIEIKTEMLVKSLRRDNYNERGDKLLGLIYMVLSSGIHTPLVLSQAAQSEYGCDRQHCNMLRALMFRIQLTLCRESSNTSSGWKALNAIFTHAVTYNNDRNLVNTLTAQPWTLTLIRFHISHKTSFKTQGFLLFLLNWLNFLKICIKNSQDGIKIRIPKHIALLTTLHLLRSNLDEDGLKESQSCQNAIILVDDILKMLTCV